MADIRLQKPSIPKFYAGRHIFITGGSGFIGKVLVEKILRSCPDIAGLHLLIRAKKGVSPAERLKTLLQVELFDVLRKQNPSFTEKLHAVNGDISIPGLGLDPLDREFLVKNVSVVFHVAATVRFNDPFIRAMRLNVGGTQDVALMAKEMPNLAVFVHVSTTYCNTDRKVIEEKLYPPHGNWRVLLQASEKLDPSVLAPIGPKILGHLPNSYTFTKSLAEHCVKDILEGKRLVIVRPSVVISTIKEEPVKGWIDNFNGPVGVLAACGMGVVHITVGREDIKVDYVPVDVIVKVLLIAAFKHSSKQMLTDPLMQVSAWNFPSGYHCLLVCSVLKTETTIRTTRLKESSLPVYNCSSAKKTITVGQMRELLKSVNDLYPLNDVLSVPAGLLTTNHFVLLIGTLVLHMLPAIFFDAILRFQGKEPRLAKLHRQVYSAQLVLEPFLLNFWDFKNQKALALDKYVPDEDKNDFSFDFLDEDIYEYARHIQLGARRHLFHSSDDTLPAARRRMRRVVLIKNMVISFGTLLLAFLFVRVLVRLLQSTMQSLIFF